MIFRIRNLSSGVTRAKIVALRTCSSRSESGRSPSFEQSNTSENSVQSPSSRPIANAVCAWSPVTILTLTPAVEADSMASITPARTVSAIAISPSKVKTSLLVSLLSSLISRSIFAEAIAITLKPLPEKSSRRDSADLMVDWLMSVHLANTVSGAPLITRRRWPRLSSKRLPEVLRSWSKA